MDKQPSVSTFDPWPAAAGSTGGEGPEPTFCPDCGWPLHSHAGGCCPPAPPGYTGPKLDMEALVEQIERYPRSGASQVAAAKLKVACNALHLRCKEAESERAKWKASSDLWFGHACDFQRELESAHARISEVEAERDGWTVEAHRMSRAFVAADRDLTTARSQLDAARRERDEALASVRRWVRGWMESDENRVRAELRAVRAEEALTAERAARAALREKVEKLAAPEHFIDSEYQAAFVGGFTAARDAVLAALAQEDGQ